MLCPPNVLIKAIDAVRVILPRGLALTLALQGDNVWRAYQEARVEAALKGRDIRLFPLPVFEFSYGLQIYRVYPLPLVTSKEDAVVHYYDELSPYLGVSHDRQLFVELSVDEARRCAPFLGSVCPVLKPIDRKAKTPSCTAAVFLQDQDAVQRNCRLNSRKWTGIDIFYIGGRRWGYANMSNVTLVMQCPGKDI